MAVHGGYRLSLGALMWLLGGVSYMSSLDMIAEANGVPLRGRLSLYGPRWASLLCAWSHAYSPAYPPSRPASPTHACAHARILACILARPPARPPARTHARQCQPTSSVQVAPRC